MAGEQNTVRVGSAGVVENSEGKVLMGLRGAHPSGIWVLPGGGVDFGETASDAFVREIKEEAGIDVEDPQFVMTHELIKRNKGIHRVIFFHKARAKSDELKAGGDVAELRWMTIEEIKRLKNLGDIVTPVLKAAGCME